MPKNFIGGFIIVIMNGVNSGQAQLAASRENSRQESVLPTSSFIDLTDQQASFGGGDSFSPARFVNLTNKQASEVVFHRHKRLSFHRTTLPLQIRVVATFPLQDLSTISNKQALSFCHRLKHTSFHRTTLALQIRVVT